MRNSTLSETSQADNDDHILPIITDEDWPIQVYDGDIEADLDKIDSVESAKQVVGHLSYTSKMPGPSFNLPASACPIGSKLRLVPGSPCSMCDAADTYEWRQQAAKLLDKLLADVLSDFPTELSEQLPKARFNLNNFLTTPVRRASALRLHCLRDPLWVPAHIYLMLYGENGHEIEFMRWHSSGDIQSLAHLKNILTVAKFTPRTRHWLPSMQGNWASKVTPSDNLVIRISGKTIGGPPPKGFPCVSTISYGKKPMNGGFRCPASSAEEYVCGDCRFCWTNTSHHVDYSEHQFAAFLRRATMNLNLNSKLRAELESLVISKVKLKGKTNEETSHASAT